MKFIRQSTHKKKKLDKVWRRPRGSDSKLRLRMQRRPIVSPGYGNKSSMRGKDPSGLEVVRVNSRSQIEAIEPKKEGAVLSGKLGTKKRIAFIELLLAKKVRILNIKDPEGLVQKLKKAFEDRTKKQEKKEEKKEVKKEATKPESIEDKLSDEEKKKLEKKEIDKLLTKKQ